MAVCEVSIFVPSGLGPDQVEPGETLNGLRSQIDYETTKLADVERIT